MKKRLGASDTDPNIERMIIESTRRTPDWKKFEQVAAMTNACRELAMMGLKDRYPKATEEEVRRRFAAMVLDRELVIKLFGWDPNIEGY